MSVERVEFEIRDAGSSRDLQLTDPRVARQEEIASIGAETMVFGVVTQQGRSRAYPAELMQSHVINDDVDGEPVLVTYCPRCDSGLAFDPVMDAIRLLFSVGGSHVYNRGARQYRLMFKDQDGTMWTQEGRAIEGPRAGRSLKPLSLERTTWGEWLRRHPESSYVIEDAGPFLTEGYRRKVETGRWQRAGDLETRVVGVAIDSEAVAFSLTALAAAGGLVMDSVAGQNLVALYDASRREARVLKAPVGTTFEVVSRDPFVIRSIIGGQSWGIDGRSLSGKEGLEPVARQHSSTLYAWLMYHPESRIHQPDA